MTSSAGRPPFAQPERRPGLETSIQRDVSVEIATGAAACSTSFHRPSASRWWLLCWGLADSGAANEGFGALVDDGASLVAPNTHTNPDMLGERRDEALDLGTAVDELTSGEVSDEEIAQAIMQSMDLPATPAAVPQGLPPTGMPPKANPRSVCRQQVCHQHQPKPCPSCPCPLLHRLPCNRPPQRRPSHRGRRCCPWRSSRRLDHGTVAALRP